VAQVYLTARRAAHPLIPALVHSAPEVREWLADVVRAAEVWVAETGNEIVAMMALDGASVEHLYVLPGYQGRGLGGRLLDIAKSSRPTLSLFTFQSNHPARAFYEKRGFRAVEWRDGRGNEERSPDVRYEWSALRPVSLDEIESLAIGAWILGTGGGGSPYLALLNLRKLYAEGRVVSLLDPAALADDDGVAVVSNMGAPLVGQERLTDPATVARAVEMMEEVTGRRFRAIMSLEIGGGNALQPFLAAALLSRPVVDADCMGRAFPEAQMTSFAICDLQMYPLTLVDVRDNAVIVARAESWKWMERLSRTACVAVGSVASTCKAPRTGREVKACGILYSTSKAIRIGRTVQDARRAHRDPIAAVVEAERGLVIFRGKVSDVNRRTTEGFLRGTATLEGLDEDRGSTFALAFQNEFAVGWRDGVARVMTPDLICVMDTVSGEAIGTEVLRYGQRATAIALPAPPLLVTPKGLEHVGPRAFGYDLDFRSVFAG
jgi:hypothetical protein